MKRQRIETEEGEAVSPIGLGGAQTWNANAAAAAARVETGIAGTADLQEMLRLASGSMLPSTVRARSNQPFFTSLAGSYQTLWNALAEDGEASDAVLAFVSTREGGASQWPPTFVNVQAAYADLVPDSENQLEAFERLALEDEAGATEALVTTLGNEARRRFALERFGAGPYSKFPTVLSSTEWGPFMDQYKGTNALDQCDRSQRYFILQADRNNESQVLLLAETHPYGPLEDDGNVVVPMGPLLNEFHRSGNGAYATNVEEINIPGGEYLPEGVDPTSVMLFLSALPTISDVSGTAFDPPPAGVAQVRQAMVPVNAEAGLPERVRDYIVRAQDENEWFPYPMYGTWLDACQLAVLLSLFQGQLAAREYALAGYPTPQSLTTMAAMAHVGEFPQGMLPEETLDSIRKDAAIHVWQSTCATSAVSPSGRFPNAERLLDAASTFGFTPGAAQRDRPELLCSVLDQYAPRLVHESQMQFEEEEENID